jgi:DNA-binding transcriptional ArsR family regulator
VAGHSICACNNIRMDADKACGLRVDSDFVELAVEVFAMLADATRVRLILALREGELSVNQLAETVGKPQSAVSQHLAKMRLARMVSTRQEGTRVFYRLENEHARQLVADAIFQAEHSLGGTPRHHHNNPGNGAA